MGKGKIAVATFLVAVIAYYPKWLEKSPIVATQNGRVEGRMGVSRGGKEYAEYLSIPYAEPPVGPLRFEPPVPVKSWQGVKEAIEYPPPCAQMEGLVVGQTLGQEDCLFLNVFTPSDFKSSAKKKPVMVYIHGGAFMSGATDVYRPAYFMDHDVVIVTLQYRLGPLGFLNTGDGEIRGNMGLKDQNLALRWIKDNIISFGGDPERITLFGESAGASSVGYHLISKASEGLFQRAILQSGASLCPWGFLNDAKDASVAYGGLVGCPTDNTTSLVTCLRSKDWLDVVSPQLSHLDPLTKVVAIRPSVETVIKEDSFITEHPRKALEAGRFSKIPVLWGVLNGEGVWKSARFDGFPELIPEIGQNWEEHGGYLLFRKNTPLPDLLKIRDFYFGPQKFVTNSPTFMQNLTDMFSDSCFVEPVRTSALFHATHGAPTYLYYFTYDPVTRPSLYSIFKATGNGDWMWIPSMVKIAFHVVADTFRETFLGWEGPHRYGIPHGMDLLMLWNPPMVPFSKKDLAFSNKFVKLFVDFAKNEEPLSFDGVTLPPIQTTNKAVVHPMMYVELNNEGKLVPEPFTPRMRLWESMELY